MCLTILGVALLAGTFSMVASESSKIAVHTIFGIVTSSFYLGIG